VLFLKISNTPHFYLFILYSIFGIEIVNISIKAFTFNALYVIENLFRKTGLTDQHPK